jgi:TolB-like protein/DNA-binding winged helix-turn-helix (wHTH) protein/Tfp pilus assembly protein PilF
MSTVLRFEGFEVDLAAGRLFKRGLRIRLREQSFRVLALLLERPGEVVTREDLRRQLWPADVFVDFENSLNAAVARLREALGDSAERPRFIETLPRHGYRFIGALSEPGSSPAAVRGSRGRRWRPAAGRDVPDTPWVLEEKLGEGGFGEVWLARHRRLKEPRVFKFCFREDRVRALKREMTLFRVWRARVGDHPRLVQLLDVNLEQPPFYLEEEYVPGRDLRTWCAAQGGIGKVPVEVRLELVAQAAEGLAAAHEAGIIHRDVKPGNILVVHRTAESGGGQTEDAPTAKLTDFGVGQVMSAEVLAGITATGLTRTLGSGSSAALMGSHAYLAPELLMGRPATAQSDVYSMGVVLYQLLVGDFTQPVTTDWARAIPDAVLREDLQRCFAGRPEERFGSAIELAKNLRSVAARRDARAGAARAAFDGGTAKIASLAVLPFANLSADPDNEFLSDGIADDLLAALSRVPELRVPGRTSCFAFKGKSEDLRKIGQALGVETVLEGSVRRAASRLRITVQLINVADGYHLWSERYDREMADVFAIQDEITRAIVAALMPNLAAGEPAIRVPRYTSSLEAYELCLRARYHHQKWTRDGLGTAIRFFEQAAARDPNCSPIYAGLAHVYRMSSYFGDLPTREGLQKAKDAALRALELDDGSAAAHVRMADILCFKDWDWAGAEREFQRALELDPDNSEALSRYGVFLWAKLRHAEALLRLQKALETDPFALDTNSHLAWVLMSLGRLDEAEELARKILAMNPSLFSGYQILAAVKGLRGMWAEAAQDCEKAIALEGRPQILGVLCVCHVRAGRPAEARLALEQLEQAAGRCHVPPVWLAVGYDAVGATGQARAWIERAIEERDQVLVSLKGYMTWFPRILEGCRSRLDECGL